ncbi:MAG: YceI family protein, partial [Candidatus Acidiferrales bacterium]
GEIHFDPATGKATGRIVVDATTGDSGNKSRDKKMHQEILESQKYPEITFTPQKITGTFNPQAASQLALDGIFQLKGQEHPLTATVAVAPPEGPALHSTVTFTIPYIKWGLKDPSTWLLKASDTVTVEIQSTAELTPDQPQHYSASPIPAKAFSAHSASNLQSRFSLRPLRLCGRSSSLSVLTLPSP